MTGTGNDGEGPAQAGSRDAVEDALARVLAAADFANAPRKRRMLQYLVGETLAGEGDRLKGTRIALDLYDRDAGFDPANDSVVRTEARRLRQALERYYLTDGAADPLHITLPKGSYKPAFVPMAGEAGSATQGREAEIPEDASIAVLPLHSQGDDPAQAEFAEGFTCSLANALTHFKMLRVIATNHSKSLPGDEIDLREVGRQLGARFLLTGSVQRAGGRIRVVARLADARSGEQAWSQVYERELNAGALFDLQDELTQSVIARIAPSYGPLSRILSRDCSHKPPAEMATFEAFMCFLIYLQYVRQEDFSRARDALELAVEREPEHTPSLAALSMLYSDAYLRLLSGDDVRELAVSLANRAATHAPEYAVAHLARATGAYLYGDRALVCREAEYALSLNPHDVSSAALAGNLIGMTGAFERAGEISSTVQALNPFVPSWFLGSTCLAHFMRGEYTQALGVAEQFTHECWPGRPLFLAVIHAELGDAPRAAQYLASLCELEAGFAQAPESYVRRRFIGPGHADRIMQGLTRAGLA